MKLRRAPVPTTEHNVAVALHLLRRAAGILKHQDTPKALDAVRHAIKSTEGAVRHARRRVRATYGPEIQAAADAHVARINER